MYPLIVHYPTVYSPSHYPTVYSPQPLPYCVQPPAITLLCTAPAITLLCTAPSHYPTVYSPSHYPTVYMQPQPLPYCVQPPAITYTLSPTIECRLAVHADKSIKLTCKTPGCSAFKGVEVLMACAHHDLGESTDLKAEHTFFLFMYCHIIINQIEQSIHAHVCMTGTQYKKQLVWGLDDFTAQHIKKCCKTYRVFRRYKSVLTYTIH